MTERILIIQLRQIGDVVLTTAIPRILKEARPGCRVTFLTEAPSHQLLAGNPYIDEILLNDRRAGWRGTLRLGRGLRRERFAAVLDFMGNPRSALLARLSGSPFRISYEARGRGLLYTHRVRQPEGIEYAVEIKKRLLGPLGIHSPTDQPEIYLEASEKEEGRALRRSFLTGGAAARLVTVDPSHRRETRRWPAPYFGELCRGLQRELGVQPVVLWGPGEEAVARQVEAASEGAAVVAPATSLRQMAALLAAADLHVGNCSAPRHMAVAVGTPTFTILGSTDAGWTHPAAEHTQTALELSCQPCNRNRCERGLACLTGYPPERALQALREWASGCLGW
jgi:ADP-heptose:LPS heptosyltransferase